MEGSSFGTSDGRPSTMVTSTPKDFQTEANSTPMTPPPSTMALCGKVSMASASVLVSTRPPISRPMVLVVEPVARMMFLPL